MKAPLRIPLRYGAWIELVGCHLEAGTLMQDCVLHIPWYARPFFIAEALWGRWKGWLSR